MISQGVVGGCSQKVAHVSPDDDSVEHRGGRASGGESFTNDVVMADNADERELVPVEAGGSADDPGEQRGREDDHGYHDKDGAVHFDQGHESREVRLPPGVPVPSQEMIERHKKAGHCPYRPWCAHCVSGAANAPAHVAREGVADDGTPEVHCDYAFFRDQSGDRENTVTVLVTKDRKSTGLSADVVPKKGAGGGYAVKQLDRNIKKFGNHGKVVLRSDGEVAIRDLLSRVSAMRASQTVMECTPKGDSRANGRVERAVQQVEKQTRVLKLAVEEVLGKFSVRHPAFTWLVLHAADSYNKFQVGTDGRTAYEKIRGRPYSGSMMEFGQCILYKISNKVHGGDMGPRWAKGIWLGKRFTTEEHVIGTVDGLVAIAGAVREHPETKWDSKLFDDLVGVPWDPLAKNRGAEEPGEPRERVADLPRVVIARGADEDVPRVRNLALTRPYFEKFGWTPGCSKCEAMESGDPSKPTLGHSFTCRLRMEGLLRADPILHKKLDGARLRQEEYLAKRIEAGDKSAKQARVEPVALEPAPNVESETRTEEPSDAAMGGDATEGGIPQSRSHSRMPSTVTCQSDVPAASTASYATDLPGDIPIPNVADIVTGASSSSAARGKRKHEGDEGDAARGDDPPDPEDSGEMGSVEVYNLGERKAGDYKVKSQVHPGKFYLCELFSPTRVAEAARKRGVRGSCTCVFIRVCLCVCAFA